MARKTAAPAAVDAAFDVLARAALVEQPERVASIVERAGTDEILRFLDGLSPQRSAEIVRRLGSERATEVVVALGERGGALLCALPPRRAATLVSRIPEEERAAVLATVPADRAKEILALASYPADTAGGRMDPRVASFPLTTMVRSVPIKKLRELQVLQVFLVDDDGKLVASVPVHEVILAPPEAKLQSLATAQVPSVQATTAVSGVIDVITRTGATSVAVVDFEGRLLGVLRQREIIAAAQEDIAADLLTMVGAGKEERALSPPLLSVKKRLPWLQLNLITAFAASAVVGLFEDTIAKVTALAILMPVVAGQSGNTGAQALAVTIRGLFMREVLARDWLRVAWKELRVGMLNGLAVGASTSAAVFAWSHSGGLAVVIGTSMIASMACASVSGALVPIMLTSFGQDPAQSSSIVLTTITDIAGFFSFLGIATLMLASL